MILNDFLVDFSCFCVSRWWYKNLDRYTTLTITGKQFLDHAVLIFEDYTVGIGKQYGNSYFCIVNKLEMANSSNKKLIPKGVRLGWAFLKDAKVVKITVSLSSLKGVKVKRKKVSAVRNSADGSFISKPAFLNP